MYGEDSFFNLSVAGRTGLALLSLVLAAALLLGAARIFRSLPINSRSLSLAARLVVALLLFWMFEWLSPQIYYQYYLLIFDGLPWQVVVKDPPGPGDLLALLTFSGKAALSQHSRGILCWALIVLAIVYPRWAGARGTA